MKKILMMGVAAIAAMAVTGAGAMTLQEAGTKVAGAAESPAVMAEVVAQLANDDQTAFLASVNEAIEAMPLTKEEKVAKAVAANQAAIAAAPADNRAAMIAEIFASASPDALAVINENLSAALFNPAKQISPEVKAAVAKTVQDAVEKRTAQVGAADADRRNAASVLMFARADAALEAALTEGKPNAAETSAWVNAAKEHGNYKWLTGSSAPVEMNRTYIRPAAPQALTGALFADLATVTPHAGFTDALLEPNQYALPTVSNYGQGRVPRTLNEDAKWNSTYERGSTADIGDNLGGGSGGNGGGGGGGYEPEPYPYQRTY